MSQAAHLGTTSNGQKMTAGTTTSDPDQLNRVYMPIQKDLAAVEAILKSELQSDAPLVDQLLEHSWMLGGKRIRPVFLLLSGAATGDVTQPHLQMAAALEMIHTATLVHDDVLDEAKVRRHRQTANDKWGSKLSILLGDYLFTHAFHVASLAGSADALRYLAQASNRVCEGEMRQNAWQGDFDLSEKDYLRMISEKTAELCGVGCKIGAFLSNAAPELVDQFEEYGRNLGVAFQIIDDVLDLVGAQDTAGKTLGTDLLNQKPTLPIIHALEQSTSENRKALIELLDGKADRKDVIQVLEKTDSIQYARGVAKAHAIRATQFAQSLPENKYSNALVELGSFVLNRVH